MAAQVKVTFTQDLTAPVKIRHYDGMAFTGDDSGNVINVELFNAGVPYSEGGTVSATAILADGSTYALTHGTITNNVVSVPLEAGALAVPGRMGLYVKLTGGSIECTVLSCVFSVVGTDTGVAPATAEASVNELIAAINNAKDSYPPTLTQLYAAVAPTFSTSTAYAAGAYVWYSGTLYKFMAAHSAGSWTGTDAVAAAVGSDVDDLKSAIDADYAAQSDGKLLFPSVFERGNIINNGATTDLTYRVRSKDEVVFAETTNFTIASGFQAKKIIWSASTGELQPSGMWYTGSISFLTGYRYRLLIARVTEDTSEVADIETFVSAVYRESTDSTLTKQNMSANAKATGDEFSNVYDTIKNTIQFHPYGLEPFQMSLFKQSANLFSNFCYYISDGYYRFRLDTTKNAPRITSTTNWHGWLIRVNPNTTYTIGPVDFKIELLTSECDLDITIENLSATDPNTITTGSKSYWMALTQRAGRDMSAWMMVEGTTYPSEYISGHPQWIAEPLPPEATDIKTIAFMGDSITAGVATHKCYHEYIHDAFGYTCLNYGYGGAGWSWIYTGTSSGKIGQGVPGIGVNTSPETAFTPNNVVARLTELNQNVVDCIVIFAGTNDWGHSVSIADLTTAIDSAFEYCKTNYTQIPVLVMTPIHRRYDTVPNSQGKTLREYADVIIEECKKYGIAYIDTMTISELYPDNEANRIYYFNQNPDSGLHPSSAGHKMIAIGVGEMIRQLLVYQNFSTP